MRESRYNPQIGSLGLAVFGIGLDGVFEMIARLDLAQASFADG
jgi:hypothetical protein